MVKPNKIFGVANGDSGWQVFQFYDANEAARWVLRAAKYEETRFLCDESTARTLAGSGTFDDRLIWD